MGGRTGFTLVEVVISLGIMSVLAVGISSAVLVSIRAVETPESQSASIRQACDISNQMMAELSDAVDVTERAARAVTFSVPDRDGDGSSEEIRYSWSGTAGAELVRYYNSEPAATMLSGVDWFNLSYDMLTVPVPPSGADYLVRGYHATRDLSGFKISTSNWVSQSFAPNLPEGATAWKPTRIAFYARTAGATDGQMQAQLRSVSWDGGPGSTLYCQGQVLESEMTSAHAWCSFDLDCSEYFSPNAAMALVIKGFNNDACDLRYRSKNVSLSGCRFATTTNGGWSWYIRYGQALLFEVYGVVVGASEQSTTRLVLGTVRWELQAGSDTAARIHAGAQLANLPE